jgi:hypothetical protein
MTHTVSAEQRTRRRRNATGASVTFGGLAVVAAGVVLALAWRSQLPDPVATHWDINGRPNGFASLDHLLATVPVLAAVLVLVFGAFTWGLGQSAVNRRIGAGVTVWVAMFLSIVLVGSLDIQRGLTDARDAPGLSRLLLVAILGSLVPAAVVAFAIPGDVRVPTNAAVPAEAPRIQLGPGERAAWISHTSIRTVLLVAVPVVLVLVGVVVLTQLWALLIVNGVVIVGLAASSAFVVRIDRAGLTLRSALGWPRYRVPLDEVVRADVTEISPLTDFGGWGWRIGRGGRVGLVLRKGPALLVERTAGRSIVVTVDDAVTAAGLLNALADRSRPSS